MKKTAFFLLFLLGAILLLVVFLLWPFLLMLGFIDGEQHLDMIEKLGQYGDTYGVLTSLFAFLAFVLLCRAYQFQKKELSHMREFMQKQTAWSVILQLCEQYREMVAGTVANPQGGWIHSPENTQGRDGLMELIAHVIEGAQSVGGYAKDDESLKPEDIKLAIEIAFSSYEGCFRLLYRIFKFIDELEMTEEERQKYARFPRAMLSNVELEAILINCLTDRGEGMKKYVERYTVLNNYAPVALTDDFACKFCCNYNSNAFGDNSFWANKQK